MEIFEVLGQVDEQHCLHVELPASIPAGPVKIVLKQADSPNAEDDGWSEAIGSAWLNDWSDPREDIYDESRTLLNL